MPLSVSAAVEGANEQVAAAAETALAFEAAAALVAGASGAVVRALDADALEYELTPAGSGGGTLRGSGGSAGRAGGRAGFGVRAGDTPARRVATAPGGGARTGDCCCGLGVDERSAAG